jgi:hypothetical protein
VDGVNLQIPCAKSGGNKQGATDEKLPRILRWGREVLLVTEQKGSCCQQTYDSWAQALENGLYQWGIHILHKHLADEYH